MVSEEEKMEKTKSRIQMIWVVRIVFLIQFVVLVVFNLTHLKYIVDYDGTVPVAQAMEIWKQKKILIEHWGYQTTMGLDSPVLLAALLYGLLDNGCLVYGISNIIWTILLLLVINDVYRECEVAEVYRYVGFILLLTPYSMGALGYMPILFTGPAFYLVKVFISVLCFDICLKLYKGISIKKLWFLCLVLLVLVLVTGISSGIYVLVSGIFPIIVCEWTFAVKENDWKVLANYRTALLVLVVIGFCVGLILQKNLGFESKDNSMTLMYEGQFVENIGACIVGILELFGAVPYFSVVSVLSLEGITFLCGFMVLVLLAVVLIFCIRRCMKKYDYFLMWGWLAFACNMVILLLSNARYGSEFFEARYHIFTMIPLLLVVPKYMGEINIHNVLPQTIMAGMVFSIIMINVMHYEEYYAVDNFYDDIEEIVEIAETSGADALIVLGEDMVTTGRVARLCESEMPVIVYATWDNVHTWGGLTFKMEDYPNVEQYAVLTRQAGYDGVGSDIKQTWSLVETRNDWQIYIGTN